MTARHERRRITPLTIYFIASAPIILAAAKLIAAGVAAAGLRDPYTRLWITIGGMVVGAVCAALAADATIGQVQRDLSAVRRLRHRLSLFRSGRA